MHASLLLTGMSAGLVMPAKRQQSLPLSEVLSTCIDAASRGCEEIRAVHAARARDGGGMAVSFKSEGDARDALTEADLRAQAAITSALRASWPGVCLVGEEDDDAAAAASAAAELVTPLSPLRRDLCFVDGESELVALEDVVIFIDPLDGTREVRRTSG